jgi:uncharacterized protein YlxW (UPF0749 family)
LEKDDKRFPLFEQHAQTVLALIVVGLLAWVALTTQKLDVKVEVMALEISHLKTSLRQPQNRLNDLTRRVEQLEKNVKE